MKIVVIGGRGLIGSKVATKLSAHGHDVITASRRSGVDSFTGEGLADAVAGADVLVDVADSPLFDDEPVMHFFTTTTTNLLSAEQEAGVKHHVALSVVGAQIMPESGYNTAKAAQENLIKDSGRPYSIVRATPFTGRGWPIPRQTETSSDCRTRCSVLSPPTMSPPPWPARLSGALSTE
jgi:uncharacterized protein YbjT (DUF2867 family)